jgi:hypothetical protein
MIVERKIVSVQQTPYAGVKKATLECGHTVSGGNATKRLEPCPCGDSFHGECLGCVPFGC